MKQKLWIIQAGYEEEGYIIVKASDEKDAYNKYLKTEYAKHVPNSWETFIKESIKQIKFKRGNDIFGDD